MCVTFDTLSPWWLSGCILTELAVVLGITQGMHWDFFPLSKYCQPWLLMLFPSDPSRPSYPSGGTGKCGVHQKGIVPYGSSYKMYPIPTRTCNLWCHQPIPETRKLVLGHNYSSPDGVIVQSLLLSPDFCIPPPVAFDERVTYLVASWPQVANTLHVGI